MRVRTGTAFVAAWLCLIPGLTPAGVVRAASPIPSENTFDRAQRLYDATDYTGAIAVLRNDAHDEHSLELLGRSYLQESDYKKAIETLEKAVALKPNDSMLHTWLARAYGRRAETAFAITALHFANRTRETFERAVELDPTNKEALGDLFDYYVQAPSIAGGGIDKAEALLPRIARCDRVGHELAQALLAEHQKQYDSAEASLRRAIELAPEKPALHTDLAKFLARRGRFEESEEAFRHARQVAPNSPRVDFERAETYLRFKRNKEEARELLQRYIASKNLTPNDPPRAEAIHLLKKAEGS
jgi:Flp pilus assembly protein TadD